MPIFQKGDMWSAYNQADLFLITTNSTLQPGNILVMGRGIATQAHERFPGLNKALGQQIAQTSRRNGQYGLFISPHCLRPKSEPSRPKPMSDNWLVYSSSNAVPSPSNNGPRPIPRPGFISISPRQGAQGKKCWVLCTRPRT